jgi:hypothetical protein
LSLPFRFSDQNFDVTYSIVKQGKKYSCFSRLSHGRKL